MIQYKRVTELQREKVRVDGWDIIQNCDVGDCCLFECFITLTFIIIVTMMMKV